MKTGYYGVNTCLTLCSSCKVMSSKAIHRIEKIWFRRLHDAYTVIEDIIKQKHCLKRCLRRKAKGLKPTMGRCSIVWRGWHLPFRVRDDGRRRKRWKCK